MVNVDENWKAFKQNFKLYILGTGLGGIEQRKIDFLLIVSGCSALDVYNTFVRTKEEKDKYEAAFAKFEQYCTPKKN